MVIQSPVFLGKPHLTLGARFARHAEIMETEPVGGHSGVKPFKSLGLGGLIQIFSSFYIHIHKLEIYIFDIIVKEKQKKNFRIYHQSQLEVHKPQLFLQHCFLFKNYLHLNSVKTKSDQSNQFKGRIPLPSVALMDTD